jgi:GNAT superfamily N-acetyltransferase
MAGRAADGIAIRELRDDERAWADAQYRAIRFAVSPPDTIALVAESAARPGQRIGLGRLVAHRSGVLELGGIWTDEAARGLGVARTMVESLLARVERIGHTGPLWCIPFAHLAPFYRSFGFTDTGPPWPPAIAGKVGECIAQGLPDITVLARHAI